eukprot:4605027-Pyramimonas_sp.AAC.1
MRGLPRRQRFDHRRKCRRASPPWRRDGTAPGRRRTALAAPGRMLGRGGLDNDLARETRRILPRRRGGGPDASAP